MVDEAFTKKVILIVCSALVFFILTVYTEAELGVPEDLRFHLILGAVGTFCMFAAVIPKTYILSIGFIPFFVMLWVGGLAGLPPYENIAFSAVACLIIASFIGVASRLRERTD
jgi:hypothetical protein